MAQHSEPAMLGAVAENPKISSSLPVWTFSSVPQRDARTLSS